ncbi:MAG: hypothetical protein U5P41_07475 [Gammaproteobacteria bacterium]|nr:hypothetical protein [Gammaproteobacteria bacterium]
MSGRDGYAGGIEVGQLSDRIQDKLKSRLEIEDEEPELAHQFSEAQRQEIYSLTDQALNDVPDQLADLTESLEVQNPGTPKRSNPVSTRLLTRKSSPPPIDDLNELTEEKGAIKSRLEELEEEISTAQTRLERKENEVENELEQKSRVEDVSERAGLASDVRNAVKKTSAKNSPRRSCGNSEFETQRTLHHPLQQGRLLPRE